MLIQSGPGAYNEYHNISFRGEIGNYFLAEKKQTNCLIRSYGVNHRGQVVWVFLSKMAKTLDNVFIVNKDNVCQIFFDLLAILDIRNPTDLWGQASVQDQTCLSQFFFLFCILFIYIKIMHFSTIGTCLLTKFY